MSAANSRVHYELFPIEGTINERGLILLVKDVHFKASTMLVENTTLENFMSTEDVPKGDAITQGFGSYVYTEQLPKLGDCMRFVFLKAKTETEEVQTVRAPRTINEITFWPNWLVSLYAIQATVALQSELGSGGTIGATSNSVTGTRYFDRYILIDGGDFNTQHIVEEFFSYRAIPGMVATEPRPTTVMYSTLGMQNSINCLHDAVKVPEIFLTSSRVEDFGTPNAREVRWELGSIFPATNMTGWVPHFRKLIVTERDGGFYYRRHLVIPPNPFKPIEI
jgi:hypothetical protein